MKTSPPPPPRLSMEAYGAWIEEELRQVDPARRQAQKEKEKRVLSPFAIKPEDGGRKSERV